MPKVGTVSSSPGLKPALVAVFAVSSFCLIPTGCGPQRLPQFVHEGVLRKANLGYYWDVKLPLEQGEKVRRMYLRDENLYCLTNDNRLWAIEAATGVIKWYARVADRDQTVFAPCHADNVVLPEKTSGIREIMGEQQQPPGEPFDAVLVNTLSKLLVYDRSNGRLKRQVQFDFPANTDGASDGELFYVGATNGWCHALLLREALGAWTIATRAILTAPVRYHGGHVYIGSNDGMLYAVQAGPSDNIVWRKQLPEGVSTGFHVDDRGVFVPCDDNRIYALSALTGQAIWKPFITEGQLRQPIQVSQLSIFQKAELDKFYALNIANGRLRWTRPSGRMVLAVIEGKVYLLDDDGTLEVVDEITGEVSASLPLAGMELFARNTTAPAIYVGDTQGQLFCIRPRGVQPLTEQMLRGSVR